MPASTRDREASERRGQAGGGPDARARPPPSRASHAVAEQVVAGRGDDVVPDRRRAGDDERRDVGRSRSTPTTRRRARRTRAATASTSATIIESPSLRAGGRSALSPMRRAEAVPAGEHPAAGQEGEGGQPARRASSDAAHSCCGRAALHGGDQQHAEAARGAVPLAEDGAGQRRRARRASARRRPTATPQGAAPTTPAGPGWRRAPVATSWAAAGAAPRPTVVETKMKKNTAIAATAVGPRSRAEDDEQARAPPRPTARRWRRRRAG